ncbi:MAG: putative Ig domain-containing protein [Chloroflexi bacterium]|nr:putative Ig domain-containing protein [Chloroflexota bacterium]
MKRWFRRYNLSAGSAGYGAAIALVLALLLLASGVTPAALAQPEPPHQFYGNVYIGGSLAAAGTKVEARVNNVKQAETIVDSQHRYGYSPLFKVPGSTGTVTFYIGTTQAVQSVAWQSGGINRNDGQPLNLSDTAIDLTVTTTSLVPDGQVGTFYTQTLQASGGTTPYTWSLYSGSLPTGLSLTGNVISGTPAVVETSTFTVQVTDAVMATDTRALSITIGTVPPPPNGGGQRLIGADDASSTYFSSGPIVILCRFQATSTGKVTEFRVKIWQAGSAKVAIYADASGVPGARLSYNNTAQDTVSGWNTLSIPELNVTKDTYYWLAVAATGYGQVYASGGPPAKSSPITFSSYTWPDPAGSFENSWNHTLMYAGWGGTVALVVPATPTRDCSALTFKWNASAGATKYHLQVNTSSGFTGTDMFNAEVGNVLYHEVTGLTAGTTYYWQVKAGNTAGWSGWSTPTGSMRCE